MERPYNQLLQAILDIGEDMQNCGAEISRVEESINRMCAGYGVRRVHTFTITANMIVSLELDGGTVVTQTRRIHPGAIDFSRLDRLNDLARYICAHAPPVEEVRARYAALDAPRPLARPAAYFGAALVTSAFAVFFGGSAWDALSAAVLALGIETLTRLPLRRDANPILYLFLTSLLTGLGGIALVRLGAGEHLDRILIGCVMLTIPGVAITNAVRDLLSGDTVSGLARLSESLLQAAGIAFGFYLAIYLWGRGL
ncbi:MAG: threonine/serine exporter family protein [Oscillospiraceae bacterium]|nr:threonine/serine exporter family protein [Oscillospiraceae bacterium]